MRSAKLYELFDVLLLVENRISAEIFAMHHYTVLKVTGEHYNFLAR